jgi:uncharacterized protein (UPF0335 family)
MSKTPRTDKEAFDITTGKPDIDGVVMADFARELEIELNEQVLLNGKGSEREYSLLGKVERLERENASLKASIKDMLHAADDLGIYPAATIQPDGTEIKRTSQQEGYNEAVMTLGSALDLIAAKHKIEVDENREDSWCWSKPLANLNKENSDMKEQIIHLQNIIEQLESDLASFVEARHFDMKKGDTL